MHSLKSKDFYDQLVRDMANPGFDILNPPEPYTKEDIKYVFENSMEGKPIEGNVWGDLISNMANNMQQEIDNEIIQDLIIAAARMKIENDND